MTEAERDQKALEWQTGVWNRISGVYVREIDERFAPVVEAVVNRAQLMTGESVLDVGAGTGAVAERAAALRLRGFSQHHPARSRRRQTVWRIRLVPTCVSALNSG